MTKMLQAKNEQKFDEFEPIYLANYGTVIDEKWFVIFELTINHLSFGYVRLSQHEYYFSGFASFFFFFFFFFCCSLLSNCETHCIQSLSD